MATREVAESCVAILSGVIEVLMERGMEHAGEVEALIAYGALLAIKDDAEVLGVPLSTIGLDRYDIDALLHKPKKEREK